MNIYIYGNSNFKEDIHKTLEHSNIKFKLDMDSKIEDILELDELKEKIQANPKDIYLIDDSKIIKKNLLNEKIKFLKPKDGIEEEFLLENDIPDIQVESFEEIPRYILKKHEQYLEEKAKIEESEAIFHNDRVELDDELTQLLASTDEDDNKDEDEQFYADLGLDNVDKDYDEEQTLEIEEDNSIFNDIDTIEEVNNFEDPLKDLEVLDNLDDINSSEDSVNLDELMSELSNDESSIDEINEVQIKGEIMDQFSQLDELNEKDVLDALKDMGNIDLSVSKPKLEKNVSSSSSNIEVSNASSAELAELISKLLNNKTLEITIKVKD